MWTSLIISSLSDSLIYTSIYADALFNLIYSDAIPSLTEKVVCKPPYPMLKAVDCTTGVTWLSLNSYHKLSSEGLIKAK